jgi:hypothetical protein
VPKPGCVRLCDIGQFTRPQRLHRKG